MRVPALLLLLTTAAMFAAGCGGPKDSDKQLSAACERQRQEVAEEESGTPTAPSTTERLEAVTLVECAGQHVRLVEGDAVVKDGEAVKDGGDEPAKGDEPPADEKPAAEEEPAELDPAARELFVSSCGGCHALSDAETSGAVGPNLDETKMDAAAIEAQIINGAGAMPPGILQGEDATSVAGYVAAAAAAAN